LDPPNPNHKKKLRKVVSEVRDPNPLPKKPTQHYSTSIMLPMPDEIVSKHGKKRPLPKKLPSIKSKDSNRSLLSSENSFSRIKANDQVIENLQTTTQGNFATGQSTNDDEPIDRCEPHNKSSFKKSPANVFKSQNSLNFGDKENVDYAMSRQMLEVLEYWNSHKKQSFMMNENVQKVIEIVKLAILEKQKFMKIIHN
jgi:hypothetical protein